MKKYIASFMQYAKNEMESLTYLASTLCTKGGSW